MILLVFDCAENITICVNIKGDQTNIDQGLAEEVVSQTLEACMFARDNQLYKAAIQPAAIVIDLIEV